MALFLSDTERSLVNEARKQDPLRPFFWALVNRAERRAASPGLSGLSTKTHWWHHASEYLTDAAMTHALKPSPTLATWVRDVTLSLVRRPVADWVGPAFRSHSVERPVGHLETAHLTWSVAIALDLALDVFTASDRSEISEALREKGLVLCQRWLEGNHHLANSRPVLNAGVSVAAAVLDDADALRQAEGEFRLCQQIFQPDGSYSESLQYGNYAAYAQMLSREALMRRSPDLAASLPTEPYALMPRWQAASFLYSKPLSGWGSYPRARSANFNDSTAIFRPSADLLLHIAARARDKFPQEAGLARWLFDTLYVPCIDQQPQDQASFGFVNSFGFLSLPFLAQAAGPLSPEQAGVEAVCGFGCGDVIARDRWGGRTILAVRGAGEPLHGPGHLHGDLNSFILVHNQERLLVDPGHSCYRNLIHELEASTLTHNTCTFGVHDAVAQPEASGPLPQEKPLRERVLQQSRTARRRFDPRSRIPEPPVHRGGRRVLLAREGDVTAIASEAAALYGAPMTEFTRFWFLCGVHALFVVDRIVSSVPVRTTWNWLLNNRDDQLDLKMIPPTRLVARRGNAAMKLFHLGGGSMGGPLNAYVHDAYHPLPAQLGEGKPGSGQLVRFTDGNAAVERTVVHAICMDDPGSIAAWHLRTGENSATLESPDATVLWKLETALDGSRFAITEAASGKHHAVYPEGDVWRMSRSAL